MYYLLVYSPIICGPILSFHFHSIIRYDLIIFRPTLSAIPLHAVFGDSGDRSPSFAITGGKNLF